MLLRVLAGTHWASSLPSGANVLRQLHPFRLITGRGKSPSTTGLPVPGRRFARGGTRAAAGPARQPLHLGPGAGPSNSPRPGLRSRSPASAPLAVPAGRAEGSRATFTPSTFQQRAKRYPPPPLSPPLSHAGPTQLPPPLRPDVSAGTSPPRQPARRTSPARPLLKAAAASPPHRYRCRRAWVRTFGRCDRLRGLGGACCGEREGGACGRRWPPAHWGNSVEQAAPSGPQVRPSRERAQPWISARCRVGCGGAPRPAPRPCATGVISIPP